MGVTCKAWEPKDRSRMTKLENELRKQEEANKNKRAPKRTKRDNEE